MVKLVNFDLQFREIAARFAGLVSEQLLAEGAEGAFTAGNKSLVLSIEKATTAALE